MRASIRDKEALLAISPTALSAYALASGWVKVDDYGDHSDVYIQEGMPEIILPRTQQLGDYTSVVLRLIEIFSKVSDIDEVALYQDLVTADRDVIRVRSDEGDNQGTVSVSAGINLLTGARDMLLAVACSLTNPQPFYRAKANKKARTYLDHVRLGQTERGSFIITLLTPVISPPTLQSFSLNSEQDDDQNEVPFARQVTRRLEHALSFTQHATKKVVAGDTKYFPEAIKEGISANLCLALVNLIKPYSTVDISLTWARTRPIKSHHKAVRFVKDDAPILSEAARLFRERKPQSDVNLVGFVQSMKRDEIERDGTITLRTQINKQTRTVTITLNQSDYAKAIQAHQQREKMSIKGNLQKVGQRWRLQNPYKVEIESTKETTNLY